MGDSDRQIHLGYAMYNTGTHPAGWMGTPRHAATDIAELRRVARMLEAACFDLILRADNLYARMSDIEAWSRNPLHMNSLEPVTLFAALAECTDRIGMVATISTTYSEPFNIAKLIGTLDHVTHGRAGWNVVTSYSHEAARNFGRDSLPGYGERYPRAREFVEAVQRLWDTYEDDAFVEDPVRGYYFDPAKFHPVDYRGEQIRVQGALNLARPPQGYPVTVQAGSSPLGRALAAETAEVIFGSNRPRAQAQAFYADMKARTIAAGRDPDHLKVLPGLTVMTGDTRAEAEARYAALEAQVADVVKIQQLSEDLGHPLAGMPLDQPLPEDLLQGGAESGAEKHRYLSEMIRGGATLRDLMRDYRRAVAGLPLCDTPAAIADFIEESVAERAADGFILIVPTAPSALESFCASVIPELQRRGVFRRRYEGRTLRDHLGLPRPANRHCAPV